jgi:preprotein translocase subunit SecG
MFILFTIIHILVCVFLVIVVLLQSGKAADIAGAFGGMGSQTAFGPRGSATVLSKATAIAAGMFLTTSLSLAILASRGAGTASSVTERARPAATQPATPPAGQTQQPSVTTTPLGQPGAQQTTPIPLEQPGSNNPIQPQPAVPKK